MVASIGSLHEICTILFEDADEESSWQKLSFEKIALGETPELPNDRIPVLLRRFETICACIKNLLTFKADFTTAIPVEALVAVICRCLAVNWDSWKEKKVTTITGLLPRLHCQILGVLQTVLRSAKLHLLLYTDDIAQVLIQTLQRCKPFNCLKTVVYSSIVQMLVALGPVFTSPQLDDIVLRAVQDCSQHAEPFGTSIDDYAAASGAEKDVSPELGACAAALRLLSSLMVVHGMEMEPELRQRIDEFLVTSLLEYRTSTTTPFLNGRCRHELYKAVKTSITTPTPRQASCLSYAVRLFSMGLQDPVFEIRQSCQEYLALCDQLIRPQIVTVPRPSQQSVEAVPTKQQERLEIKATSATITDSPVDRKRKLSVSDVEVQAVNSVAQDSSGNAAAALQGFQQAPNSAPATAKESVNQFAPAASVNSTKRIRTESDEMHAQAQEQEQAPAVKVATPASDKRADDAAASEATASNAADQGMPVPPSAQVDTASSLRSTRSTRSTAATAVATADSDGNETKSTDTGVQPDATDGTDELLDLVDEGPDSDDED